MLSGKEGLVDESSHIAHSTDCAAGINSRDLSFCDHERLFEDQ